LSLFGNKTTEKTPVHEVMARWLREDYYPSQPDKLEMMYAKQACCSITILKYVEPGFDVGDGWVYKGYQEHECPVVSPVVHYIEDRPDCRTGALMFRFEKPQAAGDPLTFQALYVAAWESAEDIGSSLIPIACLPQNHVEHWLKFENECDRIASSAIPFRDQVYVVGGMNVTFDATVDWHHVYLPATLKADILQDIDAFFKKGVQIYNRLAISPFRKLLFAGVPGTGKTMLCSAIARWALDKNYFVVYVSGANEYGAQFWKIHRALKMAASAEVPTIVLVEELDAYLDEDSKAELLNVLDGSETPINKSGTLLIATTNHPEIIDDRVMKRPGRLDRVFIIPELHEQEDAEQMLREYLGDAWQEEHLEFVPQLLARPGAFVREVALHALTVAAYRDIETVSLELLQESFDKLIDQIEAKDDFLVSHKKRKIGLLGLSENGKPR